MARTPEPKTQVVRQLIDQYGEGLTWSPTEDGQPSAQALLAELGFTEKARSSKKKIDENDFNVKKHLYLKKLGKTTITERNGSPSTKMLPKGDNLTVVLATVNRAGGLDDYRETLTKKQAEVARLRERLAEAEAKVVEMEANVATYEKVQKAVA